MDQGLIEALAWRAGLEIAWRDFRDDVLAAATQAAGQADGVTVPAEPGAEPWPPMRANPLP